MWLPVPCKGGSQEPWVPSDKWLSSEHCGLIFLELLILINRLFLSPLYTTPAARVGFKGNGNYPMEALPGDVAMPTCSEQLLRIPSSLLHPALSSLSQRLRRCQEGGWDTQGPDYSLLFLGDVGRRGKKQVERGKIVSSIKSNKQSNLNDLKILLTEN